MNVLTRKIVGINVFKKTKEGMFMHNYKIDDNLSAKVKSSYEELSQNEDIYLVVSKIEEILSKIDFDIFDYIYRLNNKVLGKKIVINNIEAFTDEQVGKYNDLDKEFSSKINAIEFEIKSLKKHKSKSLADFNISLAVKINDKINNLNIKLSEIYEEINKHNSNIANVEQDYLYKYEELVSKIKENSNINKDELQKVFGDRVVNNYMFNNAIERIKDVFNVFDIDYAMQILENVRIKDVLGDLYYIVKDRLDNVGTDN